MAKSMNIRLRRHAINRDGYDARGEYYGVGEPLYDIIENDTDDIVGCARATRGETKANTLSRIKRELSGSFGRLSTGRYY